jgi:hypothetical protein
MTTNAITLRARIVTLETTLAMLRTIKRPSLRLHRELARTRGRVRVWRRKLEAGHA